MHFSHKSGIIKTVLKHNNKWSMAYIGKSYKDGKDIMVDYKKKQDEGFSKLKGILQEKGETETIQGYEVRMANVFAWYTIVDLNWEIILCTAQGKNGDELEKFIHQLTELIESYDEN